MNGSTTPSGALRVLLFACLASAARGDDASPAASANAAPAAAAVVAWKTNGPVVSAVRGTNVVFDHFVPGSLRQEVWTNILSRTNGHSVALWTERTRPADWPASPPVVQWNHNCIIWGMKGLTAISPSWQSEGSPGQVAVTALTRRHGYTRGHGMGDTGFRTHFAGYKVWFVTLDNRIVERKVLREVVRQSYTNSIITDYTLLLFDQDLPPEIEPMRVVQGDNVFMAKYRPKAPAPWPFLKTEQGGNVGADDVALNVNVFKAGDSGSPNMLAVGNELIFCSGRSCSAPTPEMQADMDELCRQERVDPQPYQMQWLDLSPYPSF